METQQSARKLHQLYDLLPVIYRQKDADQGYPLKGLLQVIDEQIPLLERDMDQLYDNWFIETCDDWAVPYLGELVGYRSVHEAGQTATTLDNRAIERQSILFPRSEVANTLFYRRRKGTLYLLELLANQIAGWPARVVEYFPLLAMTQSLNHVRMERGQTVDLRNGRLLNQINTPFDPFAHTVDVRRPNSTQQPGFYNIPDVALFLWRLKTFSVSHTPAYCLENVNPRCYTFSVLSNDQPLYLKSTPEIDPKDIAQLINLPVPLDRQLFAQFDDQGNATANPQHYGEGKSMAIYVAGWKGHEDYALVPDEKIIPSDLTNWHYQPHKGTIAVDPELGRIAFHPRDLPKRGVWVSYYYAMPMALGGGEYERPLSQSRTATTYTVGQAEDSPYQTIGGALKAALPDGHNNENADTSVDIVIEIQDSGVYLENLRIDLPQNVKSLQIRAANGARPIIRLLDWQTAGPDSLWIGSQESDARIVLDGLLIAGRGLQIEGAISQLIIRHSTLVPGWWLDAHCKPGRPTEPSCELINTAAHVVIERSIIGSIVVNLDQVAQETVQIELHDSILDATSSSLEALSAPGCQIAHARLTAVRTTIIGEVYTHAILLGENSIFDGLVKVARRQEGCLRFCYVTPGSRTPRRYRCQPDLAVQDAGADTKQQALAKLRVAPQFNSTLYGSPTYCQLAQSCADEINKGADDESEMGVYHDLYQPQRLANLATRLDEYSPAGMNAGLILVN